MISKALSGCVGLLICGTLVINCSSEGRHSGAGGAPGASAGASAAASPGAGAANAGDSTQGGGASGTGGAATAGITGVAGETAQGGAAEQPETVAASPALPCGAPCDAAGYQCVQSECRGGAGTLLWQHRLDERYVDNPADIVSDAAGNAIVAFTTEFRSPTLGNQMIVRKYDHDGGQLWEHSFPGNSYGLLSSLALDSKGRIYVGGVLSKGTTTAFVRLLDGNGKLIRQVDYAYDVLPDLEDLAVDKDDNVILVGSSSVLQKRPVVLKKLDPNGKELWSKAYHDGGTSYPAFQLAASASGNILLATKNNATPSGAFIATYDANGNELWKDTYTEVGFTFPTAIVEGENGEVLVGGSDATGGWLRRYSSAGVLVKSSVVHADAGQLASLAARAGAIYAGGATYQQGHPVQAWLHQVSSDGVPGAFSFADALDSHPYGRAPTRLAITPQGDLLVLGHFSQESNQSVWLARFAGPAGGVPRIDANSDPHLLTRTYPDHDGSAIFVDEEVPNCDAKASYVYKGTLAAAPVSYSGATTSNLLPTSHEMNISMKVEWKQFVEEGATMQLTGGYFVVPQGPHAGETLCLTAGDVGFLPSTCDPKAGRQLKYRITGATVGQDCKGPAIDVNIKGCFYRFTDYFPAP